MKTTTILEAMERADEFVKMYRAKTRHGIRSFRQAKTFRRALLTRIEAGDRAREALKQVEWVNYDSYGGQHCAWCKQVRGLRKHAPDCSRQAALGLQEAKP